MEVVASLLSQGRTAAAQCGLFTYKSVPVIFEPPCTLSTETSQRLTIEMVHLLHRRCSGSIYCFPMSLVLTVRCGVIDTVSAVRFLHATVRNVDVRWTLMPDSI